MFCGQFNGLHEKLFFFFFFLDLGLFMTAYSRFNCTDFFCVNLCHQLKAQILVKESNSQEIKMHLWRTFVALFALLIILIVIGGVAGDFKDVEIDTVLGISVLYVCWPPGACVQ